MKSCSLSYRTMAALLWAVILALSPSAAAVGQDHVPEAASIDAILDAFYDVVSGPAGFVYDAETDRALHALSAVITIFDQNGEFSRETLAEFQERFNEPYTEPFYEVETHRIVEEYGSMAHVWSTYEIRHAREGPAVRRGIHSISLYHRGDRWWIASWSAQSESGPGTIPAKYLPGEVPR